MFDLIQVETTSVLNKPSNGLIAFPFRPAEIGEVEIGPGLGPVFGFWVFAHCFA
jgi:hypothetical protein